MVYEHYDFARNPIVADQVFFLESKCTRCGLSVLAQSIEELLQEEDHHRALCRLMRAAQ
jgi:fatty acid-binding protein DegV